MAARFELNPQSEEPALLADVRRYWERKRGSGAMPSRRDIIPSEIRSHLPSVLLVDVIGDGEDFRYRLVGTRLHDYFPEVPTGKLMSALLAPFGHDTVQGTLDVYRTVMKERRPQRIKGDGAWYGQDPKLFDAVLAPLSDDGDHVNMIFGAFKFAWNTAIVGLDDASAAERAWHSAVFG
jgi:hypothetical protein